MNTMNITDKDNEQRKKWATRVDLAKLANGDYDKKACERESITVPVLRHKGGFKRNAPTPKSKL